MTSQNVDVDFFPQFAFLGTMRNPISSFKEHFDRVSIDIDFSEKYKPLFLNWIHSQVTVYSGILKNAGEKSYHSYFSNSRKHDQT